MKKYQNGVIGVTNLARRINPSIGNYEDFYLNDDFRIIVRLSNGLIQMSTEVAQDFEAQSISVTQDRVKAVAISFILKS